MKKLFFILITFFSFTFISCEKDEVLKPVDDVVIPPVIVNELKIDTIEVKNVSVFGKNDGSITIKVKTGNPPYKYTLNDSLESPLGVFNLLYAGKYNIKVTDSKEKTFSKLVTVTQPDEVIVVVPPMEVKMTVSDENPYKSSTLTFEIDGGTKPYKYIFEESHIFNDSYFLYKNINDNVLVLDSSNTNSNMWGGLYKMIIMDSNDKKFTIDNIEIKNHSRFFINVWNANNPYDSNGKISALFSLHHISSFKWKYSPYPAVVEVDGKSYTVDQNSTGMVLNLKVGDYSVKITDKWGRVMNYDVKIGTSYKGLRIGDKHQDGYVFKIIETTIIENGQQVTYYNQVMLVSADHLDNVKSTFSNIPTGNGYTRPYYDELHELIKVSLENDNLFNIITGGVNHNNYWSRTNVNVGVGFKTIYINSDNDIIENGQASSKSHFFRLVKTTNNLF